MAPSSDSDTAFSAFFLVNLAGIGSALLAPGTTLRTFAVVAALIASGSAFSIAGTLIALRSGSAATTHASTLLAALATLTRLA